jgi:segregation and condensation protein B
MNLRRQSRTTGPPAPDRLPAVIESLLFVADQPQDIGTLAKSLNVTRRQVEKAVDQLAQSVDGRGILVQRHGDRVQLATAPDAAPYIEQFVEVEHGPLSRAALETLAIIAYKQPVTRAEIEAIRGVAAGDMLQRLREVNLIKIVGRAEDLGRPLLYGTTRRFLEVFGLAGLEDLPKVEIFREGIRGAGNMAEIPPPAVHEQPEDVSDEAESVLPGPQPPMMESEA